MAAASRTSTPTPVGGVTGLILAALLGLTAALWTWTRPGDLSGFAEADAPGVVVQILNNGFHTDLIVPRAALASGDGPLAEATRSLPPGAWVRIGWGDARFYVDQSPMETRIPDGLRAFFRPGNASVIMLVPERIDPAGAYAPDKRRRIRLSPAGFDRLKTRIEASLALRDGSARLAMARADDARFYASREHFWIGYLCNSWTARVLNAAGVPVRPLRAVTADEVIDSLDRASQLDREPSRA